jgi:hypothetical protein
VARRLSRNTHLGPAKLPKAQALVRFRTDLSRSFVKLGLFLPGDHLAPSVDHQSSNPGGASSLQDVPLWPLPDFTGGNLGAGGGLALIGSKCPSVTDASPKLATY